MAKTSIIESLVEGIAPASDLLLSNLNWIPVIGPAVGALKLLDDIRSRVLAEKMLSFLSGLEKHSSEENEAMLEKFGDASERAKIGEVLFLTLDQYTDLDKCELLGKLVFACGLGLLTTKELRRLAMAIDGAFSDDLQEFLSSDITFSTPPQPYMHYLEKVGLTESGGGSAFAGLPSATPLGQRMKDALAALPSMKTTERSKRFT